MHKGIVPLVYSIFQYEWFNTTFVCSPFASQHSDIIILELGTINDFISFLSPEAVGSLLEDLVALLCMDQFLLLPSPPRATPGLMHKL